MSISNVYFAYGSNLHPLRFQHRIGRRSIGSTALLRGALLSFSKRGIDGSGKCCIGFTNVISDEVVGVAYRVDSREAALLDEWELTACGYRRIVAEVEVDGQLVSAFTYIAPDDLINTEILPFHWYKQYVVLGALHFRFPHSYIEQLNRQPSVPDIHAERRQRNEAVLAELEKANSCDRRFDEGKEC